MECSILKTADNGKIVPVELLPYKSIVWEEGWQTSGTAQVVFVRNDYVMDAVKVGRWIGLDFTRVLMYIHSVKVTDAEVWAYGYEAKELFAKCAMTQQPAAGSTDIDQAVETAIRAYCPYTWLGQTLIGNWGTGNLGGLEYVSLAEYISGCALLARKGWKLERNNTTNLLDFGDYIGNDKSAAVQFATTLGNARDIKYTKSDKSYCNKVYAVGENGIIEEAEESPIGGEVYSALLDLRESFPQDTMTTFEYREALQNRAYMSLIARHTTEKIEVGDIDTDEFGTTYGLGDIISIDVPDLYLTATRRVTLARYTIEGGSVELKLTLSEV